MKGKALFWIVAFLSGVTVGVYLEAKNDMLKKNSEWTVILHVFFIIYYIDKNMKWNYVIFDEMHYSIRYRN